MDIRSSKGGKPRGSARLCVGSGGTQTGEILRPGASGPSPDALAAFSLAPTVVGGWVAVT